MAGSLEGVKVVLLDIEGTITSISFVKDKLFGYVRSNLLKYLDDKFDQQEVKDGINGILAEEGNTSINADSNSKDEVIGAVVPTILSLMDRDKKSTALKHLQGHMFVEAFQSREIVGELFPDVLPCLRTLKNQGVKIAIYSSGSIFAQKLLFSHTTEGDITNLLSGFFDTTSGPKVESSSYVNISKQLEVETCEILFMTDLPREAAAADQAGCKVLLVLREGNAPLTNDDLKIFKTVSSFNEILLD